MNKKIEFTEPKWIKWADRIATTLMILGTALWAVGWMAHTDLIRDEAIIFYETGLSIIRLGLFGFAFIGIWYVGETKAGR